MVKDRHIMVNGDRNITGYNLNNVGNVTNNITMVASGEHLLRQQLPSLLILRSAAVDVGVKGCIQRTAQLGGAISSTALPSKYSRFRTEGGEELYC